jgi:hypothetical protein
MNMGVFWFGKGDAIVVSQNVKMMTFFPPIPKQVVPSYPSQLETKVCKLIKKFM